MMGAKENHLVVWTNSTQLTNTSNIVKEDDSVILDQSERIISIFTCELVKP